MNISKTLARVKMCAKLMRNVSSVQLSRLPVPPLHDTLKKCLRTIQPLVTPEELNQTEAAFKKFGEPGNIGSQLQTLLLKRAETEENWLSEWWLNTAYLEYRSPVVVFSSPGLVMPRQEFQTQDDQLQYAAQLILAVMDFKFLIDRDQLKQEMMGKHPLDMAQYKKVFGTCRLPKIPRDELAYHPDSKHILVMHQNNMFQLHVMAEDGSLYSEQQLLDALKLIVELTEGSCTPLGILTSDHRDNWSKAYQLLKQDQMNAELLQNVESALFVLCLDQPTGGSGEDENGTTGLQTIHGYGAMSNGGNRWFDKTMQFIVGEDGRIGLTYEHSPAEGQPIASIVDHILAYIESRKQNEVTGDESLAANLCKPLRFSINKEIQEAIRESAAKLEILENNLEGCSLSFEKYGKEFIKTQKLSPDSFIQMAIQLAFFRLHNVPGAHYETASTRMFLHGRTETIRSCSVESVEFAKTMLNSAATPLQKVLALKKAVTAHKDYTLQALNGLGVDRHLLGLKLIGLSQGLPVPPLYFDPGYLKSLHMRLSTSQVAVKGDGFMIYGPLVDDGYGCCYNPRPDDIKFGITAFKSCPETSAKEFKHSLSQSLMDMQELLISTPLAHL